MQQIPKVEDCLALQGRRLARILTKHYNLALRPSGVRITQFTLLHLLHNYNDLKTSQLAEMTDTDVTTLTRNLGILERNGWITIETNGHDTRKRDLQLTQLGQNVYHQAYSLWVDVQAKISEKVDLDVSAAIKKLSEI